MKRQQNQKELELSKAEIKRRKKERLIIVIIIISVAILTFIETKVIHFGMDFPISNTILMFILININLLLLLTLIFLVFRNLVKLYFDRRKNVSGSKLRTKLVVAFITLSLLPTIVLFFFSIRFITTSIEFWFNIPVEQALDNSLSVGRQLYGYLDKNNQFYIERTAFQIVSRNLLAKEKSKKLANYIQIVQRSFNVDAVEVYSSNFIRLTFALEPKLEDSYFGLLSADALMKRKVVFKTIKAGELINTIGTIPYGVKPSEADAFIVASTLVPPALSKSIALITKGADEYQQVIMLKKPVQTTTNIALSIVALLVIFCSLWFAFFLAKSITIPIKKLAEGTRRVAEGDLNFLIQSTSDDEIGMLVNSFNKMTEDLNSSRKQLAYSGKMLSEQNTEIEARRQYMSIVLKNISAGVISLDKNGNVSTINKAAEKMLRINSEKILNKHYKNLLIGQYQTLSEQISEKIDASRDVIQFQIRITVDGKPRSFAMHINSLKNEIEEHMGQVIVFDDLTELEKAQRMVAWREVARRIAHEVKNPLTPISLSAQRLKRRYGQQINEPVFDECTRMIIDHVDLIRNLVNEFAAFAKFPTANLAPSDLPSIINETIALYRESHKNIAFFTNITDDIPNINLDRQQIKQAMINLTDNAIAAIKTKGNISITLTYDPILKNIRLEITDTGKGISDEEKTRLFEPYFSTKKSGMGLGLAIVNSIISDHNGMIQVQDNKPHGARFVIELPI
ncbi:MAG: PAS domain-containing sensor histidine kinase [Desulfobacteraceae bacterium 4572_19]|nr:MAG: PAS domain-containing sensor histidine kinase [Desulfobacteraceae bacterium 4572_19]